MLLVLTARDGACKSRACAPKGSALSLREAGLYSHCAFGFSSPNDSHTCWTPWSVFQDGSGGSPTYTPQKGATAPEKGRYESGHRDGTVAWPARSPGVPRPRRDGSARPGLRQLRNGSRRPTKGEVRPWKPARPGRGLAVHQHTGLQTSPRLNPPVRTSRFHPFSSQRFHALLNSLFKVLFNFPSRYLFAIGLVVIFSLRWSLPPALGCSFKQPDSTEGPFQGPGDKAYGPRTLRG